MNENESALVMDTLIMDRYLSKVMSSALVGLGSWLYGDEEECHRHRSRDPRVKFGRGGRRKRSRRNARLARSKP